MRDKLLVTTLPSYSYCLGIARLNLLNENGVANDRKGRVVTLRFSRPVDCDPHHSRGCSIRHRRDNLGIAPACRFGLRAIECNRAVRLRLSKVLPLDGFQHIDWAPGWTQDVDHWPILLCRNGRWKQE